MTMVQMPVVTVEHREDRFEIAVEEFRTCLECGASFVTPNEVTRESDCNHCGGRLQLEERQYRPYTKFAGGVNEAESLEELQSRYQRQADLLSALAANGWLMDEASGDGHYVIVNRTPREGNEQ